MKKLLIDARRGVMLIAISRGKNYIIELILPASRSRGGACDNVCCALVGLMSPGLDAATSQHVIPFNLTSSHTYPISRKVRR